MALFQAGRELRAPRANRINAPRTGNGRLLGLVIITNNSIGGIGRFIRSRREDFKRSEVYDSAKLLSILCCVRIEASRSGASPVRTLLHCGIVLALAVATNGAVLADAAPRAEYLLVPGGDHMVGNARWAWLPGTADWLALIGRAPG